jgi:hypothetical protein
MVLSVKIDISIYLEEKYKTVASLVFHIKMNNGNISSLTDIEN